jgi:hypothetical protein
LSWVPPAPPTSTPPYPQPAPGDPASNLTLMVSGEAWSTACCSFRSASSTWGSGPPERHKNLQPTPSPAGCPHSHLYTRAEDSVTLLQVSQGQVGTNLEPTNPQTHTHTHTHTHPSVTLPVSMWPRQGLSGAETFRSVSAFQELGVGLLRDLQNQHQHGGT